jgi:hypothetical protein
VGVWRERIRGFKIANGNSANRSVIRNLELSVPTAIAVLSCTSRGTSELVPLSKDTPHPAVVSRKPGRRLPETASGADTCPVVSAVSRGERFFLSFTSACPLRSFTRGVAGRHWNNAIQDPLSYADRRHQETMSAPPAAAGWRFGGPFSHGLRRGLKSFGPPGLGRMEVGSRQKIP